MCTQIHVRSSLGNRFRTVRRKRFAVRLCPLSALFCTPVCNLTVLNLCCPRCFVFSEWRTAVACSSFIDRLQLVCFVKRNSLFPFFRGCPSPLSATPTFLPDPFVSFTDIFPRSGKSPTLWGITLAELSQLDRSRLRRAIFRCCCMIADIFMAQNFAAL